MNIISKILTKLHSCLEPKLHVYCNHDDEAAYTFKLDGYIVRDKQPRKVYVSLFKEHCLMGTMEIPVWHVPRDVVFEKDYGEPLPTWLFKIRHRVYDEPWPGIRWAHTEPMDCYVVLNYHGRRYGGFFVYLIPK